jgi:hypothetical protein
MSINVFSSTARESERLPQDLASYHFHNARIDMLEGTEKEPHWGC